MALGEGNEFGVKINGAPKLGSWYERDVSYIKVAIVGGTGGNNDPFKAKELLDTDGRLTGKFEFGTNGWTEKVLRVIATRGTIMGLNFGPASTYVYTLGTDNSAIEPAIDDVPGSLAGTEIHVILGHAAGLFMDGKVLGTNASPEDVSASLALEINAVFDNDPAATGTTLSEITRGRFAVDDEEFPGVGVSP